ncbi:MAG: sigma-70 family RNA polymerase sigma factor [Pseudorhodoplanes sp.]|nr:sigma-70 family RNA polymerase sigma factor [Pseudorhodoplanes sp.]
MTEREVRWAAWMRQANAGDGAAYNACLQEFARALRAYVRRGLARAGREAETEDVVQEILIAVHLKRQTWDDSRPVGPWLYAIARYKMIDALRRRGGRIEVPVDDFADVLAAEEGPEPGRDSEISRSLAGLPARQRDVVQCIAVDGHSISETASHLKMNEGAVRVALHRGLASLAKRHGRET